MVMLNPMSIESQLDDMKLLSEIERLDSDTMKWIIGESWKLQINAYNNGQDAISNQFLLIAQ